MSETSAAFRELVRVLEGALQEGAESIRMEYENREWIIYHVAGNTGLGAPRVPKDLCTAMIEEIVERAGLDSKTKGKMQLELLGKDYEVSVKQFDNFGDSAFELTLKECTKKAKPLKLFAPGKRTAKKTPDATRPAADAVRIYTLAVFISRGGSGKTFNKRKSGVSRTIQIRGDQTLEALHDAIFHAFDRYDEHLYEFQLGTGPRDRQGPTYGPMDDDGGPNVAGHVSDTTIDDLRLKTGRAFGYLFDFGDCWQHQIIVEAVEEAVPEGKYPKVIKKIGKSPSQYLDEDEADPDEDE